MSDHIDELIKALLNVREELNKNVNSSYGGSVNSSVGSPMMMSEDDVNKADEDEEHKGLQINTGVENARTMAPHVFDDSSYRSDLKSGWTGQAVKSIAPRPLETRDDYEKRLFSRKEALKAIHPKKLGEERKEELKQIKDYFKKKVVDNHIGRYLESLYRAPEEYNVDKEYKISDRIIDPQDSSKILQIIGPSYRHRDKPGKAFAAIENSFPTATGVYNIVDKLHRGGIQTKEYTGVKPTAAIAASDLAVPATDVARIKAQMMARQAPQSAPALDMKSIVAGSQAQQAQQMKQPQAPAPSAEPAPTAPPALDMRSILGSKEQGSMKKFEGTGMTRSAPPAEGHVHEVRLRKGLEALYETVSAICDAYEEEELEKGIGDIMSRGKQMYNKHKDLMVAPAIAAGLAAGNYAHLSLPALDQFGRSIEQGKSVGQSAKEAGHVVGELNRRFPGGMVGAIHGAWKNRNEPAAAVNTAASQAPVNTMKSEHEMIKFDKNGQWSLTKDESAKAPAHHNPVIARGMERLKDALQGKDSERTQINPAKLAAIKQLRDHMRAYEEKEKQKAAEQKGMTVQGSAKVAPNVLRRRPVES